MTRLRCNSKTFLHNLFLALQQSCVHKFRKWLNMAPLPIKREDDSIDQEDNHEGPYARVVACAYIPDK